MFKFKGTHSDDIPYEIRMDDILFAGSTVLPVTSLKFEAWNLNGGTQDYLESKT